MDGHSFGLPDVVNRDGVASCALTCHCYLLVFFFPASEPEYSLITRTISISYPNLKVLVQAFSSQISLLFRTNYQRILFRTISIFTKPTREHDSLSAVYTPSLAGGTQQTRKSARSVNHKTRLHRNLGVGEEQGCPSRPRGKRCQCS